MSSSKSKKSHRRRGAGTSVRRTPKARPSQPDTLTLEKFNEAFTEPLGLFHVQREDGLMPDSPLARRREAVEKCDVLALYGALEWCHLDRFGWPGFFAVDDDSGRSDKVELPRWLLVALLKLIWRGIPGVWPKGRA